VAEIDPIDDGIANEAFAAIQMIFQSMGVEPRVIILGGIHHGESALKYLSLFPKAIIYGFEPNSENLSLAKIKLGGYADRIRLYPYALSSYTGQADLNVNSHDATHSLYEIGRVEFWDEHVDKISTQRVETRSLDSFVKENGLINIDLLHLDIQGSELAALQGSTNLLEERAICLIRCEAEFEEIYLNQPLFWDIGKFLSAVKYRFIKNVDNKYREEKIRRLVWADSLFLRAY
jgi:FkbM family methyltransferase